MTAENEGSGLIQIEPLLASTYSPKQYDIEEQKFNIWWLGALDKRRQGNKIGCNQSVACSCARPKHAKKNEHWIWRKTQDPTNNDVREALDITG